MISVVNEIEYMCFRIIFVVMKLNTCVSWKFLVLFFWVLSHIGKIPLSVVCNSDYCN